jgi:alkyl hydroperoxide reductase subunit AhpC
MKAFGVFDEERRLAKRSYIIVDKEGVVRYKSIRPSNREPDLLSTETLLSEAKKIKLGAQ